MRFSIYALAALLPLLSMISAEKCVQAEGNGSDLNWWPIDELPKTTSTAQLIEASFDKKYAHHYYHAVANVNSNNQAYISVTSGLGPHLVFRISYKDASFNVVKSYLITSSKTASCQTQPDYTPEFNRVQHITIQVLKT
jgi:hypothetical protein